MASLLVECNACKNFINTVDSEATKESYRFTFKKFTKFCGIEDYEYEKMLLFEPKKLEALIADYITHLKVEKKLAPNTVNLYFASISHFYQMNDVTLNWKKLSKFKGRKRTIVEDKPYSKEQIRQLLDFADLRMKCIILLMSSAGLRRGAIPTLRIKDLTKIEEYGIYEISVYKKEQEAYTTFVTPECSKYLDQYFDWRAVQGERLTDTSPVIRKDFSSLNAAKPKTITAHGIDWMIANLLDKSCIRPRTQHRLRRSELMQCHGFRKYFETTAKLAGMDSLLIDRCMGHKTGLHDPYTKLNGDQTLEGNDKMIGYIGAIDDLTIDETNILRRKVDTLTIKADELSDLKNELNEFKEWKSNLTNEVNEIHERYEREKKDSDKIFEKERVEWIKKENEQRKRLGLNLIEENAYKLED